MKIAHYLILSSTLFVFSCEQETNNTQQEIRSETTEIDTIDYLREGQLLATKTQLVLGENLMKAIKSEGTAYAVSFCSEKAILLTDSMSVSLNARLKRVSNKHRNPDNKANNAELAYINEAKLSLSEGKAVQPKLTIDGNKRIGYYPIFTDQRCVQCHGQAKTEISPTVLSKINDLYPHDLAKGYLSDELRGIWVVEMDKSN